MIKPLPASAVLDRYFLEARAKLLDVAAILDRIDRGGGANDPRTQKLAQAIDALKQKGDARAEAIQAIFSLPIGQLSPILEDERGFHIVRVVERQDMSRTPFSELQPEIKKKIKAERSNEDVRRHLNAIKKAASGTQNLMPVLIDAARARVTVGEAMNAMAEVFGRYNGAAKW